MKLYISPDKHCMQRGNVYLLAYFEFHSFSEKIYTGFVFSLRLKKKYSRKNFNPICEIMHVRSVHRMRFNNNLVQQISLFSQYHGMIL